MSCNDSEFSSIARLCFHDEIDESTEAFGLVVAVTTVLENSEDSFRHLRYIDSDDLEELGLLPLLWMIRKDIEFFSPPLSLGLIVN